MDGGGGVADDAGRALLQAAQACAQSALREVQEFGPLPPAVVSSPYDPSITSEELEMMERDDGLFVMYAAAIRAAFDDIVRKRTLEDGVKPSTLRVIVPNAGYGRLILVVLEAAQLAGLVVEVHAFDANEQATAYMMLRYGGLVGVSVHSSFALLPSTLAASLPPSLAPLALSCDLVVTAFLGALGDNAFLPELVSAASRLFAREHTGVVIPKDWTVYVAPVSCPEAYSYITLLQLKPNPGPMSLLLQGKPEKRLQAKELPGSLSTTRCHIVDRASLDFLAEPAAVYEGVCAVPEQRYTGRVAFLLKSADEAKEQQQQQSFLDETATPKRHRPSRDAPTLLHGIAGYFTATLYGDVYIDSRHTSPQRTCFHYEAFFMPLSAPVQLATLPLDKITGRHILHVALERIYKEDVSMKREAAPSGDAGDSPATPPVESPLRAPDEAPDNVFQHVLWYEWAALRDDGAQYSPRQNVNGSCHFFHL